MFEQKLNTHSKEINQLSTSFNEQQRVIQDLGKQVRQFSFHVPKSDTNITYVDEHEEDSELKKDVECQISGGVIMVL